MERTRKPNGTGDGNEMRSVIKVPSDEEPLDLSWFIICPTDRKRRCLSPAVLLINSPYHSAPVSADLYK